MDGTIEMRSIGVVRSPHVEPKGTPIQGVFAGDLEGIVQLEPEYADGLKDLDGFSHAILIYHFHKSDEQPLIGKPYLEDEEKTIVIGASTLLVAVVALHADVQKGMGDAEGVARQTDKPDN